MECLILKVRRCWWRFRKFWCNWSGNWKNIMVMLCCVNYCSCLIIYRVLIIVMVMRKIFWCWFRISWLNGVSWCIVLVFGDWGVYFLVLWLDGDVNLIVMEELFCFLYYFVDCFIFFILRSFVFVLVYGLCCCWW